MSAAAASPYRHWLLRLGPRGAALLAVLLAAPLAALIAAAVLALARVPVDAWAWPLLGAALPATLAAPSAARLLVRLLHELEEARGEAERLALIDPLTGVASRRQFFQFAEAEFARSRRAQVPMSVLVIDLDGLRHINDAHGHAAGDQVLLAVAGACRGDLRDYDTLARHGGDSFAVLLPHTGSDTAVTIAERVRTAVAGLVLPLAGVAEPPALRVTVGVATAVAGNADSVDDLMEQAEQALSRAQQAGRNRVGT
ncbi:GGDEF domain-containing protein [Aquincola sp. J276]|uniref:GGDEF domain-containing protein n=1 Tax=Aquincola sp. J276 TaxID=2898432 RepID=UPI002150CF3D|nr:GGDEF domain-containing protein [Aquincola sp. J276]MCR5865642.1 GGDEF domain-containing protein [Aquincola sp. J276]